MDLRNVFQSFITTPWDWKQTTWLVDDTEYLDEYVVHVQSFNNDTAIIQVLKVDFQNNPAVSRILTAHMNHNGIAKVFIGFLEDSDKKGAMLTDIVPVAQEIAIYLGHKELGRVEVQDDKYTDRFIFKPLKSTTFPEMEDEILDLDEEVKTKRELNPVIYRKPSRGDCE